MFGVFFAIGEQNNIDSKHDDVIKWKHFPCYWPFVREIHRSPVNFPHKGQWRGALMFTLICARMNGWVNNREADDLRRYRVHYDVIVMIQCIITHNMWNSQVSLQHSVLHHNVVFNVLITNKGYKAYFELRIDTRISPSRANYRYTVFLMSILW